ncbi:MAG: tetratricopeptide repeat protein [Acetobacteraceae bacterium]|nr:tetratricopeptide repeat protein [Acetobacteraceae bacterium]
MTATIEDAARHYAARDLSQAARACLEILQIDPLHFDALHLLGVICTNQGQYADGVSYLLRANAIRPNDARLQSNLGSAYGAVQRFDKAVKSYRLAMTLNHREPGLLNNLGLALAGMGREAESIDTFQAALAADPSSDPALYNLGRAQAAIGQFAAAEAGMRRLLDRLPADASASRMGDIVSELARALIEQGRALESLEVLRAAAAARPDIETIRWHESLVLLLLGHFTEGWAAYESRWLAPNFDKEHEDFRVLDLHLVARQRVLVTEEQGRGDVIQFLRYIEPLATRGARVTLSVYADLLPLAMELPAVELVLGPGENEAQYDQRTSIMSLPLAFHTDFGTIPAEVPYLHVPASRLGRMSHYLGPATRPRIGVVWSGSPASHKRSSMPVAALEPILRRPDIEFHCLQKSVLPSDRAWLDRTRLVTTHEAMIRDFADTGALIEAMDLVITIDTAVAHLAGALAKPVWIMLPFNPDWRWLLGREDSPWYPTARLFRQTEWRGWDNVVQRIARALHL